jgi:hypothetical protein
MAIQRITTKVIEENSVTWTKLSTDVQSRVTTGVNITGGTISGLTAALPVASGGTNATTTDQARINLGVDIGVDIQQFDADLLDIAQLDKLLGNMIVSNGTKWIVNTPEEIRLLINAQLHHAYLDDISAVVPVNTDVLVFNGTNWGVQNGAVFRQTIGCEYGVDIHAFSTHIDKLDTLSKVDGGFVVANGSTWVVETGATARASLGLVIGADVQSWSARLDELSIAPGNNVFAVGNGTGWTYKSDNAARNALSLGTAAVLNMGGTGSVDVAYANHTHPGTTFWDQYTNGSSIIGDVPWNNYSIYDINLWGVGNITFNNGVTIDGDWYQDYLDFNFSSPESGFKFKAYGDTVIGSVFAASRFASNVATDVVGFKDKLGNDAVVVNYYVDTTQNNVQTLVNNYTRTTTDTSGLIVNGRISATDSVRINETTVIESDAKIDWDRIKNVPNLGNILDIAVTHEDVSTSRSYGATTINKTPGTILGISDTTGWTFKVIASLRGVRTWRKSYSGNTGDIWVKTTRVSNNSWNLSFGGTGNYKTSSKGYIVVTYIGWKS